MTAPFRCQPKFNALTWKAACAALGLEGVDLYGGTKHSTATALRRVATYEEVRKMTGHTTNKAFDRYLRLEGEAMKGLYARVKTCWPSLTMDLKDPAEQKFEYLQ